MTPEQKLKHHILLKAAGNEYYNEMYGPITLPGNITDENVDEVYETLKNEAVVIDTAAEIRSGEVDTEDVESPSSGYFENKAVAAKMPDGSWVGWTYWYGGGKHASPEDIDWIDEAYDLDMTEEAVTVIVKHFTRRD